MRPSATTRAPRGANSRTLRVASRDPFRSKREGSRAPSAHRVTARVAQPPNADQVIGGDPAIAFGANWAVGGSDPPAHMRVAKRHRGCVPPGRVLLTQGLRRLAIRARLPLLGRGPAGLSPRVVTHRIGWRTVALLLLLAAAASSAMARSHRAPSVNVRVTPSSGLPATRFTVSFTAPDRSGHVGVIERAYEVSASAAREVKGCASSVSVPVPHTAAHVRVKVILAPSRNWCPGAFRGRVDESQGPWCPEGARVCPKFASTRRTIGRFTFRVRAAGTDTTPPTFAGLQSAFACTPGPQRPGETTPFTLTWKGATDDSSSYALPRITGADDEQQPRAGARWLLLRLGLRACSRLSATLSRTVQSFGVLGFASVVSTAPA